MAWGEAHLIAGTAIYGLAYLASDSKRNDGKLAAAILIPAVILSAMTHWPLDAMNLGTQTIYHGTGQSGWIEPSIIILRSAICLCLLWIFIKYPMSLACALPAWLICDWEWLVGPGTGIGFHNHHMWPHWLITQWGLLPWAVAFGLFISIMVQGTMLKDIRKAISLAVTYQIFNNITFQDLMSKALRSLKPLMVVVRILLSTITWIIFQSLMSNNFWRSDGNLR